ncbi:MAG: hypothetical protein MUQ00_12425 [Candidatus Aminicenantes bacterium]|nr:hypothetical protein [Candidatus Aminicenantes bacterium]
MKIKTIDAARSLGIHPAHLLLHIAALDRSLTFNDVWPEIDEAWVKTVASAGRHRPFPSEPAHQVGTIPPPLSSLSKNAIHVLDKLSRQGKWGKLSVPFEALQNLTHIPKRDLEDAVGEIRKAGYLDHDGSGRGTISLDPARQKDIKKITQESSEHAR